MLPSELAGTGTAGAPRQPDFAFLDTAYIQSHTQSGLAEFLDMPASAIMEKEVVWAGPEDTVQDVIAKMQQHNVGYVLVGVNGVLEGLVSGSNITSAVSLYLRPMFAKWRRPQDDATLGVKVKWIMSRPVRTVRPDATLAAMIEGMRRCGGRCLPVVDAKGAVQGIVTVFDILLRILESDKRMSWAGKPPQAPALLL
jgi:CBS domain-containing membrane protein